MNTKLCIVLTIGALSALGPVVSSAHTMRAHCRMAAVPYGSYQGPDGTYDSESDFVRDLRGIPCGVECTRAAQARWARWVHHHCVG